MYISNYPRVHLHRLKSEVPERVCEKLIELIVCVAIILYFVLCTCKYELLRLHRNTRNAFLLTESQNDIESLIPDLSELHQNKLSLVDTSRRFSVPHGRTYPTLRRHRNSTAVGEIPLPWEHARSRVPSGNIL